MNTDRERSWRVRTTRDLSQAIREVRESRGVTQDDLAAGLGIDRSYLSRMEGRRSSLLLDRMLRVLRHLGAEVTVTWSERHNT